MAVRVQIPVYTDRWMRGDRYGEIVRVRRVLAPKNSCLDDYDVAFVKLDLSGKTIKVMLDDCTMIGVTGIWSPVDVAKKV